ncbi:MAG: radical SAM family heme chaperone HemW [Myxococcota bacterium]|nr:radical SAM family heme chaperone HemW [Myxococcota bacterium]
MSWDCDPQRDYGIYVHVPFCRRRCPYCDFSIVVRKTPPVDAYVDAVWRDFDARSAAYHGLRLRSVYFGGGTPSLLPNEALDRLLRHFRSSSDAPEELCLEANPEDLDPQRLSELRALGFNRLSVGVQSFDDEVLQRLGRAHDGAQAMRVLEASLQAGFDSVNVDLIHGLATQTQPSFISDHTLALRSGVPHISSYALTIEPGSRFGHQLKRGLRFTLDEEQMAECYEQVEAILEPSLEHYEVSNYARVGHHGRHNLLYWLGAQYLGLGPSAHSLWRDEQGYAVRRANQIHWTRYLEQPQRPAEAERLSPLLHAAERIFMQLRTRLPLFPDAWPQSWQARFAPSLQTLLAERLLEPGSDRSLRSTRRGLMMHDHMARRILEAVDDEAERLDPETFTPG